MVDFREVMKGEVEMLVRVMVLVAVGYASHAFLTSSAMSPITYAWAVGVFFVIGNVLFWGVRWLSPSMLDTAEALERKS